jgi:membrane associated rhomboid family serine protease
MIHHVEFLIQFLPLACAHLVIPPLSYFNGERLSNELLEEFLNLIYSAVPRTFLTEKFITSLLNDASNTNEIRGTMVTHIFVHTSYSHLFGNLSAALQFAYPVYEEFGTVGLYFLFISGGVASSIPTFLRTDQKRAFSELVYDRLALQETNESYVHWVPGILQIIMLRPSTLLL